MRTIGKIYKRAVAGAFVFAVLNLAVNSQGSETAVEINEKADLQRVAGGETGFSGKQTVLEIDPAVLDGLSEEERLWYARFQNGVAFFDGWSTISQEILITFPEAEQPRQELVVQRLGIKIGTEWARDNDVRKIDTTMLKAWGAQIQSAIDVGPEATALALELIEAEVDGILRSTEEVSFNEPQT